VHTKIGEMIVSAGLITPEQRDLALANQRSFGGKMGTNLVELGFVSDETLAKFLSHQLSLPAASRDDFENISPEALQVVSREFAETHRLVPLRLDKRLLVAIADPNDLSALDELKFKSGRVVQAVIAPEIWIVAALERHYRIARKQRFVTIDDELSKPEVVLNEAPLDVGGLAPAQSELSLDAFLGRLVLSKRKEEVLAVLLDFLLPFYAQTAVYVLRKDRISGWTLRGFPIHDRELQKLELQAGDDSTFGRVLLNQETFEGTLPNEPEDRRLIAGLGLGERTRVEIRPISYKGRGIVAVLGAVNALDRTEAALRNTILDAAFAKTGLALEWVALRALILDGRLPG
jgi:hypothetical protein